MPDTRKRLLGISVYLTCALLLGAQLHDPMPTPNTPHSFEYYDSNRNGVLDYEELAAHEPAIRDIDNYGGLKLVELEGLPISESEDGLLASDMEAIEAPHEYDDSDEVDFYQWRIFVD